MTTWRPTLRWVLPAGADGAHVELCRDRACATPIRSFDASGSSGAPDVDLPPGVAFWRLQPRAGGATGPTRSATWQFRVGPRSAPLDASYGSVFDANGDGVGDLAVTAQGYTSNTGRVYVYHGSAAGLGATPATILTGDGGAGQYFGVHATNAGDVNGDGFADLAVSSLVISSQGRGRVQVYLGGPTGVSATASASIDGMDGPSARFGSSMISAGDVNGDGYADLLVASVQYMGSVGRVHVFLGSAAGLGTTPATSIAGPDGARGAFGNSLASIGDLDRDGFDDVVVGAPGAMDTGHAFVYRGSASGLVATNPVTLPGLAGDTSFGFAFGDAGDLNGDGRPDLVTFVTGQRPRRVLSYLASSAGFGATPSITPVDTAATLAVGDCNDDGFDDVVVGEVVVPRLSLIAGGMAGLAAMATATIAAPAGDPTFGTRAAVSDVDGDGRGDVFVGSTHFMNQAGAVYYFQSGAAGVATTPTRTIAGFDGPNARFGWVFAR